MGLSFVALDVETANCDRASICQIGLAVYENGKLSDEWSTYVDPKDYFDYVNISIHGINASTVIQLIEHLKDQHIYEPDVAEELQGLLMRLGFMRPDGTLAVPHPAAQEEPTIVVPDATAGGETGKLWTSDIADPSSGQRSKIWTPEWF